MDQTFSPWLRWVDRNQLGEILKFPGVYIIALSEKNLTSTSFGWSEEIIYIGMTNSKGGLKSRLQQFENTIKGKSGHGGAERVRHKHGDYNLLVPRLFVSVNYTECDVSSNKSSDLQLMGKVAQQEYECFAVFVEKFPNHPFQVPEFNNKQKSKKK